MRSAAPLNFSKDKQGLYPNYFLHESISSNPGGGVAELLGLEVGQLVGG